MFYLFPGPLSAPVQPRLRLASFNFRSSRFCRNSSLTILRISIAFPPTCRCSSCFVAQANVPKSRHSSEPGSLGVKVRAVRLTIIIDECILLSDLCLFGIRILDIFCNFCLKRRSQRYFCKFVCYLLCGFNR